MAIEERVFSTELLLCMKRYCWRESRAKIVAIVKTKMQLVLGKIPWTWTNLQKTTNVCQKFKETTHTQKYGKTHWLWFLKGFPLFAHWRGSQNIIENVWFCSSGFSYAIQEKFTAWQVNSTLNFTWKTDIGFSREI